MPTTINTQTVYRYWAQAGTNLQVVKASPGLVYLVRVYNFSTAGLRTVRLYDTPVTPVINISTLVESIVIPAAASASQPSILSYSYPFPSGLPFLTGIAHDITGGQLDNDATPVSANDVLVFLLRN